MWSLGKKFDSIYLSINAITIPTIGFKVYTFRSFGRNFGQNQAKVDECSLNFLAILWKYFQKEISVTNSLLNFFILSTNEKKTRQKLSQLPTIMNGCLRFLYFHVLNIANLAKCTYGLSPLEQHHKIERKNTDSQFSDIAPKASIPKRISL